MVKFKVKFQHKLKLKLSLAMMIFLTPGWEFSGAISVPPSDCAFQSASFDHSENVRLDDYSS